MARRFDRLHRLAVRRLSSGDKITEHGIAAERMENGDTRYSVNIMVDGQRIHRVIGRESEAVTRRQCEEFIQIKRTEAREGRLSLPKGRKTHLSLGWEKRTAQPSPIHSWKLSVPSVVSAVKSGASLLILSAILSSLNLLIEPIIQ